MKTIFAEMNAPRWAPTTEILNSLKKLYNVIKCYKKFENYCMKCYKTMLYIVTKEIKSEPVDIGDYKGLYKNDTGGIR